MIKRNRHHAPSYLVRHERRWTEELLIELNDVKEFSKIRPSVVTKYNQAAIKDALCKMYEGKCCYCESPIGMSDYEHIEHLRPKSKFPHLTFEWTNLHWCCQKCNMNKGDKWDLVNPIIDPSYDTPSDFMSYDPITAEAIAHQARGQTTIKDVQLNRPELVQRRQKIGVKMMRLLRQVQQSNDEAHKAFCQAEIDEFIRTDADYTMFMESVVHIYT